MPAADVNRFVLDNITLFHRPSCGYCQRVFRALDGMNLQIREANVSRDYDARTELCKKGGKSQVPAIRIEHGNGEVEWMYESLDIIDYLEAQLNAR